MRPPVANRAFEGVLEQLELGVASQERRGEAAERAPAFDRGDRPKSGDRVPETAQLERSRRLRLDRRERQAMRGLADQDLARPRRLLEARRDVDGLARRERRVGVVDDDLARLDADPGLEAELVNLLEDRQRGADRPLGVVLVGARDAERRHHGVAGELLHRPAVRLDALGDTLEEGRDPPSDNLGIRPRDELRRRDEVREQDRCELSFHHSEV